MLVSIVECHATVFPSFSRKQRSCVWNNGFERVQRLSKSCFERESYWQLTAANRINGLPRNSECSVERQHCGVVACASKESVVFGRLRRDADAKLAMAPSQWHALSKRRCKPSRRVRRTGAAVLWH